MIIWLVQSKNPSHDNLDTSVFSFDVGDPCNMFDSLSVTLLHGAQLAQLKEREVE